MKILSHHVSRSVFEAMLLVLFLLLGLELVFSFIGELDSVHGSYKTFDAVIVVLLSAPGRAYDMLPIAALVGGMTGLGMLASSSELTIMRAAGVSIGRIVWWVVKPALIFVAAGLLLTQYVVPVSEKLSEQRKDNAMEGASTMKWFKSSWQREGKNILQIGKVEKDGSLRDVTLFYFNDNNFLESASLVGQAHYDGKQGWQLRDLKTTEIREDGSTQLKKVAEAYWPSQLTPSYLSLLTQDAESLSLTDLYQYAHYMKAQGLDSDSWFLQFWKKALAPLATLSMVLIACSFIFGPLRSVTMGLRILAGVLAGLTFRYGQDFLGYASLVYDFSPALAASIPIACCLLIGGVALARVK